MDEGEVPRSGMEGFSPGIPEVAKLEPSNLVPWYNTQLPLMTLAEAALLLKLNTPRSGADPVSTRLLPAKLGQS